MRLGYRDSHFLITYIHMCMTAKAYSSNITFTLWALILSIERFLLLSWQRHTHKSVFLHHSIHNVNTCTCTCKRALQLPADMIPLVSCVHVSVLYVTDKSNMLTWLSQTENILKVRWFKKKKKCVYIDQLAPANWTFWRCTTPPVYRNLHSDPVGHTPRWLVILPQCMIPDQNALLLPDCLSVSLLCLCVY